MEERCVRIDDLGGRVTGQSERGCGFYGRTFGPTSNCSPTGQRGIALISYVDYDAGGLSWAESALLWGGCFWGAVWW